MTLGEKLRFYRTAQGYTQKEIAYILSMERSTYTYYELDKTLPALQAVRRLANLYGVTMEFLLDEATVPFGGREFLASKGKHRNRRGKKRI